MPSVHSTSLIRLNYWSRPSLQHSALMSVLIWSRPLSSENIATQRIMRQPARKSWNRIFAQQVFTGTKQKTFVQPLSAWSRITMEKCHARWRTYSRFLALPVRLPTLFWVMPLGLSRDSWLTRTLVALHDASAVPPIKTPSPPHGL